ncbi:hypothetical protein [Moorena producens]|uniref:hypothetical protein n=1 Tax=Moorena producens TaxID=1155739 RepID=UPI003C725A8A
MRSAILWEFLIGTSLSCCAFKLDIIQLQKNRQTLSPTPYSLLPTPYSLLPTPYSLLPLLYDKYSSIFYLTHDFYSIP